MPRRPVAIVAALAAGLAIGIVHGLIITKIGVPSFVVTLAGLLAWNGVVLLLIGDKGTVILQNDVIIGFANDFLPAGDAWIVLAVGDRALRRRSCSRGAARAARPACRPSRSRCYALRVGAPRACAGDRRGACANQDRGIPYVFS